MAGREQRQTAKNCGQGQCANQRPCPQYRLHSCRFENPIHGDYLAGGFQATASDLLFDFVSEEELFSEAEEDVPGVVEELSFFPVDPLEPLDLRL